MKIEHITPRVIELAKEIAKYWKMKIYKGCWWVDVDLVQLYAREECPDFPDECFSIPDIINCVDKIKELKLHYRFQDDLRGWYEFLIWDDPDDGPITSARCSDPLEAALSALAKLLKREDEKQKFVR